MFREFPPKKWPIRPRTLFASLLAFTVGVLVSEWFVPRQDMMSRVISLKSIDQAREQDFGWVRPYLTGQTSDLSQLDVTRVDLKPNQQVEPLHQHSDESLLLVLSGEGHWLLGSQWLAAKPDDLLFASADQLHGIKNTGEDTLSFVIIKWREQRLMPRIEH